MTWLWIILSVTAALILLTYGFAALVFNFIFKRPKRSKKVPKYYVDTPHYKVSRAGMAIMDKLPVKDVYMQSRDGLKLHAYLYPSETESKKFILGIHGYKSYARPEFGPYIEFYRSLGFNMLLPDDRAHAPSEGKYIGFGVLDRLDCVDWAKYLVKEYGEDTRIILHGVSMGGATVLAASGERDLPSQVEGTVSDCGFCSAKEALSYQFKHMAHIPLFPILPLCEKICKHRAGFGFSENTPLDGVKNSKVPILIVQGEKDAMVPAFMAQKIYDNCTSKKKLMLVKEAGHAESIAFEPELYHNTLKEFFGI